ncbi:hypothetical protein BS47DRAFT_1393434 [Hydnum rufescens UP504]|uniref:DUF4100 domain-containing protein n=1 Tax=Hydnum rufescens UP504 TaxID=1448309 RepID=A0A9P6AXU3_9AGAM|nr:hypothetical protein BS47DRAFT_1393434 [Hydnum rufescens UP504]
MLVLLSEDVEMRDGMVVEPTSHKQRGIVKDKEVPSNKIKPKAKSSLEDVVICEKGSQIKKRASLAYCFASELQENVDMDALYKSLMDKEIMVKLGDILGSSFELCKRLQLATKTQWIPVKPEIAGSSNVEATVNVIERTDESMVLSGPRCDESTKQI